MKTEILRVWLAEARQNLEKDEAELIALILADAGNERGEGFFETLKELVYVQTAIESITTRIALLSDQRK